MENKIKCKHCNKFFSSRQSKWNHVNKFHRNENCKIIITTNCIHCNKNFCSKSSLTRHLKSYCKIKNENIHKIINEKNILSKQNINNNLQSSKYVNELYPSNLLKNKSIINELEIKIKKIEENQVLSINNQLINIITDKNKKIEELNDKINSNINIQELIDDSQKLNEFDLIDNNVTHELIFNNNIIHSRINDNYINIEEICKVGNCNFNDWYKIDSTKNLINDLINKFGMNELQLIDNNSFCSNTNDFSHNKGWIHPDLAIQLAQWISPIFALYINQWIRKLLNKINMLNENTLQKEIKIKNQKIQLLENICMKKQKRTNYPEKNLIYLITTEDNKKKRIYIIGKAKNLKDRLSTYNKTAEHEVIFYKECKSEENMNIIELMVLNKLQEYKEKANRDRFILPLEKDIAFFTNIIENCINFL
jgi:hypothetical protein